MLRVFYKVDNKRKISYYETICRSEAEILEEPISAKASTRSEPEILEEATVAETSTRSERKILGQAATAETSTT